jgi:ribosomal protein S18 acetylase RimI-like enzyme
MRAELASVAGEPSWPEGVQVRVFEPGDERVFYEVHQEAFEDTWEHISEPFDEWAHWLLEPPAFAPELWFLAHEGGEPAGVAICHPHGTLSDTGWIRILAVRRPWRRRGLGRALLLNAFAEFRRRGFAAAGLGVDATSETGANRLYESAGMHVSARFDILEKVV